MKVLALLTGVLMVVGSGTSPQQKETPPRFRTGTLHVSVNVSVRAGNNPVGGLAAADFILTDNGVRQTIDELSFKAVPIDVTLILDTSGSASPSCGTPALTKPRRSVGLYVVMIAS